MRRHLPPMMRRWAGICLSLLPISLLALASILWSGSALAAAQVFQSTPQAPTASLALLDVGRRALWPLSQTPPTCDPSDDANQCANKLTNALGGTVKAVYQVGVWVVIVVGVLVIIWTTPAAITAAVSNNSRVIGQVVTRIGLIIGLILLAINSWTILQWFLGGAGSSISSPTLPGIGQ